MVVGKKWGIAGIGVVVAAILVFVLWPSDADRIKTQFEYLAENIAKSPGESPLTSGAKAKRIRTVFTDTVTLHAPAYGYVRDLPASDLPALALSARAPYRELSLDFYDATIAFPQKDQADARVTARLRGRLPSGENVEDFQELNCRLHKVEGAWRFASIEVVEVLQP